MDINRPYTWEELGLLGESVRAPAMLARRTAELDAARDHGGDRSLPTLNAICHANVAVHRDEQALAAGEQREAAGELDVDGEARLRLADDEQLLHHSVAMRERAEREAALDQEPGN